MSSFIAYPLALVAFVLLAGCPASHGSLSDAPIDPTMLADSATAADTSQGGSGEVIATGMAPFAITVDEAAVYWTDPGSNNVASIPLAGGTPTILATNLTGPYFLQHDAANLYWGLHSDDIEQIPLDGGAPVPLQTSNNTLLVGLAVDATAVYHTEDFTVPQDCSVVSVPKGGGTRVILASGGSWDHPGGITVSGGKVFWGVMSPGAILSVPVGGGATSTLASGISPVAIVADATNVYWTDGNGAIMKVAQTGGAPVTLAMTDDPYLIAVDGTSVYWSTLAFGKTSTILKVAIAGGTPVTLESGLENVRGIAVDATSIYWTEQDAGVVKKAAK